MELKEAIKKRASIRTFKDQEIPLDDIKELVKMGGQAPSVNNYQPWTFYAITNKQLLEKMADTIKGKVEQIPENDSKVSGNIKSQVEWFSTFFESAPCLLALAMDEYESVLEKGVTMSHQDINIMRNYPDIQSAGAAIQNILLSAVDMGYGACWMSAPMIAKEELENIIGIEKSTHLIAFVAVGVPAKDIKSKEKKPVDEIFRLID